LSENLCNNLNLNGIKNSFNDLNDIRKNASETSSKYKELELNFNSGDKKISLETLTHLKSKLDELKRKEEIAVKDLDVKVKSAVKYSDNTIKESDDNKIVENIKDSDNKSSLFYLDELLTNFDSLNGILKLVVYMIFSSSIIL
jgi:hypothetical protein